MGCSGHSAAGTAHLKAHCPTSTDPGQLKSLPLMPWADARANSGKLRPLWRRGKPAQHDQRQECHLQGSRAVTAAAGRHGQLAWRAHHLHANRSCPLAMQSHLAACMRLSAQAKPFLLRRQPGGTHQQRWRCPPPPAAPRAPRSRLRPAGCRARAPAAGHQSLGTRPENSETGEQLDKKLERLNRRGRQRRRRQRHEPHSKPTPSTSLEQ